MYELVGFLKIKIIIYIIIVIPHIYYWISCPTVSWKP